MICKTALTGRRVRERRKGGGNEKREKGKGGIKMGREGHTSTEVAVGEVDQQTTKIEYFCRTRPRQLPANQRPKM